MESGNTVLQTFHLENERAHLQIPHSVRKMQEQQVGTF